MEGTDAVVLENYWPTTSGVMLRKGFAAHRVDGAAQVETLMVYQEGVSEGSSNSLFGVAGGKIYDFTATGTGWPSALVTALSNSRFQHTMFTNSGGSFLIAVNGADTPRNYDGASWSTTPAIIGVTPEALVHVASHKQRLWFVEVATLSAWYLGVEALGGAATEFRLNAYFRLGGELMAIFPWTIDGGAGVDDLLCFLTSEGEVAVFQGTNPASASTWALVGIFRVGAPLGRRCFLKFGGDVILVTEDGFIPLAAQLIADRVTNLRAISDRIRNTVKNSANLYRNNFGWQPLLFPAQNMLLFNVPVATGSNQQQYVMNTITNAWCKFSGMHANCWEVFNSELYFGGNAGVWKAWTGRDDAGDGIDGKAKTAFSHLGARGRKKRVTMARVLQIANSATPPKLAANFDYQDREPAPGSLATTTDGVWDTSLWDVGTWGGDGTLRNRWQAISGVGTTVSLYLRTNTKGIAIEWISTDILWEMGEII